MHSSGDLGILLISALEKCFTRNLSSPVNYTTHNRHARARSDAPTCGACCGLASPAPPSWATWVGKVKKDVFFFFVTEFFHSLTRSNIPNLLSREERKIRTKRIAAAIYFDCRRCIMYVAATCISSHTENTKYFYSHMACV